MSTHSEVRIPPDGRIARRFADAEHGLTDGGKRYMRDCLLEGMREDPMPEPRSEHKITKADGIVIQQKVRALLPRIEQIRVGELPLDEVSPPEPSQPELDF